ncbi:peptidyl-alpha-hydroxyglycine alpha-amidating lyase family protein [Lignipirellula cremea]|uniref:Serine/threonine-protein kinase PknD n=1 Tax=Lignipirellula cremea TaxID=2528010 RepID=A0A518DQV5_9BACT|nr:peptidyl-alpha-hydroxyglycine alpha-amidating lyase family protein [Lignipirellula cremea]QDU94221.1 Serine/threonine-protein kinase PknD [Lignipirellula cremea]
MQGNPTMRLLAVAAVLYGGGSLGVAGLPSQGNAAEPVAEKASAEPVQFGAAVVFGRLPDSVTIGSCAAVSVDSQGRIYLFHRGRQPIRCYDQQGDLLRSWGDDEIHTAHGLRIDADDNVWVTDMGAHRVRQYSPRGDLLLTLGTGQPGDDDDQFDRPTDLAFGAKGEVFISDGYGNSRVLVMSPGGVLQGQWGKRGVEPGQFHLPHSLLIDSQGRLLVGDRENDRIQVFTQQGKLLEIWKGYAPYGLALDPAGNVFVADGRANQVLQLDSDGKVVQRIGRRGDKPGEFQMPHMLAFDADGNLFVAEVQGKRLQKFPRLTRP